MRKTPTRLAALPTGKATAGSAADGPEGAGAVATPEPPALTFVSTDLSHEQLLQLLVPPDSPPVDTAKLAEQARMLMQIAATAGPEAGERMRSFARNLLNAILELEQWRRAAPRRASDLRRDRDAQVREFHADLLASDLTAGERISAICRLFDLSQPTIYRIVGPRRISQNSTERKKNSL